MKFDLTNFGSFDATDQSGAPNLDIKLLLENSSNPRQPEEERRSDAWPEFVASIVQYGILEPLLISPPNATGRCVIQRGHRRFYGAQDAGLSVVPVRYADSVAETEKPLGLFLDNHHRASFEPYEEALYLQAEMKKHGLTQHDLCEQGNLKKAYVSARLLLCQFTRSEYVQLKTSGMTIRDIEQLARNKKDSPGIDLVFEAETHKTKKQNRGAAQPQRLRTTAKDSVRSAEVTDDLRLQREHTLAWVDQQLVDQSLTDADRAKWEHWKLLLATLRFA